MGGDQRKNALFSLTEVETSESRMDPVEDWRDPKKRKIPSHVWAHRRQPVAEEPSIRRGLVQLRLVQERKDDVGRECPEPNLRLLSLQKDGMC